MRLFQITSGHYGDNYIFSIGSIDSSFLDEGYRHKIGRFRHRWIRISHLNVLKEL